MTRAILLITAVALLGGCGDSCDTPGSAVFYWRFVNSVGQTAGDFGVTDAGCATAGVDQVQIDIAGTTEVVDCVFDGVPGALLPGFTTGTYDYVLTGLRNGEQVFSRSGATTIRECGETRIDVDLQALTPQSMVVFYDFNGAVPTSCSIANQPVRLTYRLVDAQQNIVDTTERILPGPPPQIVQDPVACDPQFFGITLPSVSSGRDALALGDYTFSYFQAVDAGGNVVLRTCSTPARHTGFPIVLNLTSATAACP